MCSCQQQALHRWKGSSSPTVKIKYIDIVSRKCLFLHHSAHCHTAVIGWYYCTMVPLDCMLFLFFTKICSFRVILWSQQQGKETLLNLVSSLNRCHVLRDMKYKNNRAARHSRVFNLCQFILCRMSPSGLQTIFLFLKMWKKTTPSLHNCMDKNNNKRDSPCTWTGGAWLQKDIFVIRT